MRRTRAGLLVVALLAAARPAVAQLWEVHLGAVASYGTREQFGPGVGAVLGVAPGRFAYAALRYVTYAGSTRQAGAAPTQTDVRDGTQTFTVDLALMFPAGHVDIMPGIAFGAAKFTQSTRPSGSGSAWQSSTATEFMAAPGIAAEFHVARQVALIPELQYRLAHVPALPYSIQPNGVIASVRVVLAFEISRIRQ
jgi:hypothetical protein